MVAKSRLGGLGVAVPVVVASSVICTTWVAAANRSAGVAVAVTTHGVRVAVAVGGCGVGVAVTRVMLGFGVPVVRACAVANIASLWAVA